MSAPMLEVQSLNAWYGAAQILFDLSFDVGRGEVVALMGRNGAGKSTTIKTLMGIIAKRSGTVHFCGENISRLRAFEIREERRRLLEERRRWETEQLRGESRRKDLFLAMLAHELRNPLAPLVTGLELMELIGLGDEQLETTRRSMARQVRHLTRLVDDLLDISRISTGIVT